MRNLESHAREELARINFGPEGTETIVSILRLFANEWDSGGAASCAIPVLTKLLEFKPLSPLTGEDDEWADMSEYGEPLWQNKRGSTVFKRADGSAYDIKGKVFVEPDGCAFTSHESCVPVVFPYVPKTEYVRREARDQ